jgi:hypothetical protein
LDWEYGGKTLVPIPDAAFLRWRVGSRAASCTAAYDGCNLSAAFFLPHSHRHSRSSSIALCTALTVDPDHRRVALP